LVISQSDRFRCNSFGGFLFSPCVSDSDHLACFKNFDVYFFFSFLFCLLGEYFGIHKQVLLDGEVTRLMEFSFELLTGEAFMSFGRVYSEFPRMLSSCSSSFRYSAISGGR